MSAPDQQRIEAFGQKHRASLLTLLFTDIVGSAALKQQLGDRAAAQLIGQHHALVRSTLQEFPDGEELSTAGDSFFLVFATPSAGVKFALVLLMRLRELNRQAAVAVQDRLGLHLGEVLVQPKTEQLQKDLTGLNVDICSRVMGLAQGGQILLTRPVFDSARQALKGDDLPGLGQLSWLNHGPYQLKGIDEPIEVCEVRPVEAGPLTAPSTSEKARRVEAAEGEAVLGWRPALGTVVPNTKWVLEEKLGEGGFGEVWLGRHQVMKERRVFKFCFRADRVRSLKREMTLFRLIKERIGDHPNIVSLREVYFDQPPFYVEMAYAEGQHLASWCAAHGGADKVPLEVKLEIVAQIADALQAAHDAGVIHRDVKPANILVSGQWSVVSGQNEQADSSPATRHSPLSAKLTDFGIGQVVSQEYLSGVTKAGFTQTLLGPSSSSQTGTQLYMAPELLAGRPASTRSDIYSLGVVLYQLLVGDFSRPVATDWAAEISDSLLKEDLQHCFAGNPENRFAAAALLARSMRSLPQRRAERAERELAERHAARRQLVTRASVGVAAGLVLLAGALGYGLRRAKAEALNARRIAYASDLNLAWRALKDNNLGEVRALLQAQVPPRGEQDLRGWEWRHLWQASRGEQLWTLGFMEDAVMGLGWLPDGQLVAGAGAPASVSVWDPERRKLVRASSLAVGASGLAVSPDGRLIAVADWTVLVRLLEAESLQVIAELRHEKVIFRVGFSPDSKMLSARGPEELAVWEVASRKKLWATNGTSGSHSDAPFSPDGHSLFCQMAGGYLGVFDATSGALVGRAALEPELASQVAMSKDGQQLAAADWVGRIFIVDLARSVTKVLTNRTGAVHAVAFSPDGRQLATGGFDGVIILWEAASGSELASFRGHGNDVFSLLYAPDGERLFSGGADGTVRAWRAHPTRTPAPAVVPPGAIAAAVSRNGRFLPLYHTNTQFGSVLDLETLREGFRAPLPLSYWSNVQTWAISPDGQRVAFGKLDGSVDIWANGKVSAVFQAHSNALAALEFSPDGSRLATAARGGEVRVWEGKGFRPLRTRALGEPGHENHIQEMVFAPDGSLLVVPAGNIDILSLRQGGRDRQIRGPGFIPCVDISSDGSLVAAGLGDEVRVWEVSSGRVLRRLHGGRGDFKSVSFSPDGRRLLASDSLGVTWLWDISTGRDVGRFQSPGAFSLARFQTGGDTIVLQPSPLGGGPLQTELLRAPTWSEIEETEKAEEAARQVWKSKKKEP